MLVSIWREFIIHNHASTFAFKSFAAILFQFYSLLNTHIQIPKTLEKLISGSPTYWSSPTTSWTIFRNTKNTIS